MKKLSFYFLLLVLSTAISCKENSAKKNTAISEIASSKKNGRPNILFLLSDDLGYGELGSYGQKQIATPVLDSLAKVGMRFTNFYAGNAVCSPSRAVLMTGKKSSTNTIRGNNGIFNDDQWQRVALNKDEITLGEMLGEANYKTAFIGKWHLGIPDDVSTWAHDRGFQYAVQEQWTAKYGRKNFNGPMEYINGMQDSISFDYTQWNSHDEFRTNLALDYLDNNLDNEKPFFLLMSYRAPHGHEYDIGNKDLYMDKGWPAPERLHAAKITLLDQQIGRLLYKLEEMGELENTLVLFTSDNGPHHEGKPNHNPEFFDSNGALRGIKRDLYEGGIRVPLIAYWKGKIAPGNTNDYVGGFQDVMPTLAEVAGIDIPMQTNGVSMLPVLLGKQQVEQPYLNWEFVKSGKDGFRQSARIGNFKGVRYAIDAPTELYDLQTDISETKNIASEHPDIIEKMNKIFKEDRTNNLHYPYGSK